MANVLHKTTLKYIKSVNTPDYNNGEWLINPDLSAVQNVPKKYWKIENNTVVEMTQAEKDQVDLSQLPERKMQKIKEIDIKTKSLIDQGFEYNSKKFSLSAGAQFNWNSLKVAVDGGLLTENDFPFEISTHDHNTYSVTWEEINSFSGLVLNTVNTHLSSGRKLKEDVINSNTVEELDTIIDDR